MIALAHEGSLGAEVADEVVSGTECFLDPSVSNGLQAITVSMTAMTVSTSLV
jgi:hypothetical protein